MEIINKIKENIKVNDRKMFQISGYVLNVTDFKNNKGDYYNNVYNSLNKYNPGNEYYENLITGIINSTKRIAENIKKNPRTSNYMILEQILSLTNPDGAKFPNPASHLSPLSVQKYQRVGPFNEPYPNNVGKDGEVIKQSDGTYKRFDNNSLIPRNRYVKAKPGITETNEENRGFKGILSEVANVVTGLNKKQGQLLGDRLKTFNLFTEETPYGEGQQGRSFMDMNNLKFDKSEAGELLPSDVRKRIEEIYKANNDDSPGKTTFIKQIYSLGSKIISFFSIPPLPQYKRKLYIINKNADLKFNDPENLVDRFQRLLITGEDKELNIPIIKKDQIKDWDESIYFPFNFVDLRSGSYCYFRAYLDGLSETFSPNWNDQSLMGRSSNPSTYVNTSRTINFSFAIPVHSPLDLEQMMKKINWLTQLVYPSYKKDGEIYAAPVCAMTIGNLYDNITGYLESLNYDYSESTWEISKDHQLPKSVKISTSLKVIDKEIKDWSSSFFGNQERGDYNFVTSEEEYIDNTTPGDTYA